MQLDENLTYKEEPVAIVDHQVKKLYSKEVASMKVIYKNHSGEEAPWEPKEVMQAKYPHLFASWGIEEFSYFI